MKRALAACLALVATSCADPGFELADRVSRPRILAIVAERPEVRPGDPVRLSAVLAGAPVEAELRWSMCPGDSSFTRGGFGGGDAFGVSGQEQFGETIADPGCAAVPSTTPLQVEDGFAVVPGTCADPSAPWRCTEGLVDVFTALGEAAGVPSDLTRLLVDEVGVLMTVQLEVYVDGERVETAFKRVHVVRRESLGTNPPAPRFAVGDVWMRPDPDGDARECVPELGVRPVVAAVSEVRFRPDPDDETWREMFPVVAIDGTLIEGSENAYYSWFSTAGEFDPATSVAPVRDTTWVSGEEVGVVPIWLVVRDGHLGLSACRFEVEVVESVPAFTGIDPL